MAAVSTTGLDLIVGALRNINSFEAGETLGAQETSDALQVLNDLLESWSIDHLAIYAVVENILQWTAGQNQYTIGNAPGGIFTGTLTAASLTITGVTVPANLQINSFLTEIQGLIPPNTYVTAFNVIGNTVTMSAGALANSIGPDSFNYTIPGNFFRDGVTGNPIPRPLRITNSFTRITASGNTGLDYQIEFEGGRDKYVQIGLKGLAGPWPIVGWYNPTYPLGNIYVYPNPSQVGQVHLFTDTILSDFTTATQAINLPQGYARAIKKNLALELAPEYGKTAGALLVKQAMESLKSIKSLNSIPAVQAFFDRDIVRTRRNDAGWIMHGGFI